MGAMAEIQTEDVCAGMEQFGDLLFGRTGWAQGGDNLRITMTTTH
jgi:hypothetical protein